MIKIIIFDFGGIISGDNNDWDFTYKRFSEVSGLTSAELENIFRTDWEDISVNKKSYFTFFEAIVSSSKKTLSVDALYKIYKNDTKLYMNILDIIKDLKSKGFRVVIFSNESKLGETVRLKKVDNYVDKIYSSATLGLRKPDPEIYKLLFKKERIAYTDALFIDDKNRNIIAAEKLGIRSILYKNPEQLLHELNKQLFEENPNGITQ